MLADGTGAALSQVPESLFYLTTDPQAFFSLSSP